MLTSLPRTEDMLGQIKAVRVNTGQKCAIVWAFMDREVWLDEVPVCGTKRALYEWHKRHHGRDTIMRVWKLEGEAHEAFDRLAEADEQQTFANAGDPYAIERHPDFVLYAPTVIESDPYVCA